MNRRIVIAELPSGSVAERHFRAETAPLPSPGPGEVLTRTLFASLDPVNRAQMRGRTYRGGLDVGDVMPAFTVSALEDGTLVAAEGGWQQYAALPASSLVPIDGRGPLSHHLGVLGLNGLTAYFGLLDIGRVAAGETVLVSAAAGATGNVAGQLARIHGARVVGLARPRKSAASSRTVSASTRRSTIARRHSRATSRPAAPRASTSTSTTWAARCSTPSCRA